MSKGTWLYALNAVHRPNKEVKAKEGVPTPIEVVAAGRVFEAHDAEQADDLVRLGAAREATKDEVTLEEERRKREGVVAGKTTILASQVPANKPQNKAKEADNSDVL